jgi:hypothetical protein
MEIVKAGKLIWIWAMVLVVLMLMGAMPVLAEEEETVGPKAVFQPTRLVVEETVLQGKPLEGVFEVKNEGDEVLEIVKVSPG